MSSAKNFVLSSRTTLPLVRAFMDDMDLMAQTVAGGQDLLSRSMVALNWARMENRADKSRSIVIKKGRTLNVNPFYTCNLLEIPHVSDSSNYIPSIHTKSVKLQVSQTHLVNKGEYSFFRESISTFQPIVLRQVIS